MIINEQVAKLALREAARSDLIAEYDIYDIAAAKLLEQDTGYPVEIILSEGWFTDKIKSVGEWLKKSVAEPAKYGWAKYMPELYGQQTYKFWKRPELRKAADKEFQKAVDEIKSETNSQVEEIFSKLKAQVADLKQAGEKELAFPNVKSTEEFYLSLFGTSDWSECEKMFD